MIVVCLIKETIYYFCTFQKKNEESLKEKKFKLKGFNQYWMALNIEVPFILSCC